MGYELFFVFGAIIILGFITSQIFEKTKFPDILILMAVGILIGPALKLVDVETSIIPSMASFIGTLALIILLFDGGLNLNLFKVLASFSKAASFTILVFSLTVLSLGISMKMIFGWSYAEGLLFGAVVGGTSSAVIMPIVSKLTMSEKSKVIISLESALTDALCIISTIAIIEFINRGTMNMSDTFGSIASAFTTSIIVAGFFAFFWIEAVSKVHIRQVGYLMTLAVVFILYSLVEFLRGNGAISVLVFALLLSNFNDIAKKLKMSGEYCLDTTLHTCQVNVSFFVHTFFFIFVGLIFDINAFNPIVLKATGIIFVILFIARVIAVKVLTMKDKSIAPFGKIIVFMMARGLAAAVLAAMPRSVGINIPNFEAMAFSIIIFTNLATTLGIFFTEKNPVKPADMD